MASCHTNSKTIFLLALVGIDYLSALTDSLHYPHSQNLKACNWGQSPFARFSKAGFEVLVREGFDQSVV